MATLDDIEWAEADPFTSREMIGAFERKLGITFPDDYKAFAQKYAGGMPRSFADFDFVLDGQPFNAAVGVFLAYQTWDDWPETETIQWVHEHGDGLPERFVPITSGGGSDYVGYDFKSTPPKLAFWKFGVDEPVVIADTFTDFLAMLYDEHSRGGHEQASSGSGEPNVPTNGA